ncbi:MAG: GTP-binding protein [candidate division WOR-3 bacterium]|nr:GTP-binding protein [candidate division WOR-3 bacterium]
MTGRENRDMKIAIVGHVDHGKSTIIGRMLADTDSLPEGKLKRVRENCRRTSRPFEYAFLLDALKDEQSQGITIDSARIFFSTDKRQYTILDAPGHIEFLKNMVTGASNADAALLVIDADEGIKENSKRHGYLLSMLGIKQIAVIINKMDLVDYSRDVFNSIETDYREFLSDINIETDIFIPVSGLKGDNIVAPSPNMKWFDGMTVIDVLDSLDASLPETDKALRIPVQDVYKFTRDGDNRRIIAGKIETGIINVSDTLMFMPSGKKSTVKTIEYFNGDKGKIDRAGNSTGFTLTEQIYVKRGDIACRIDQDMPEISRRIKANIFWLDREPLEMEREYIIKLGTQKIPFTVESIEKVIDASDLSFTSKDRVERHDVAECILTLKKELAYDIIDNNQMTGRFVIVNNYEISGGGIIPEVISDRQSWVRDKVITRNEKWIISDITKKSRAGRYNQKASIVFISGEKGSGRKLTARNLEKMLFSQGKLVYYMGMGNVLYGVDADIKEQGIVKDKKEHLRRLGEIAYLMMDAGMIIIITALDLTSDEIELVQTVTESDNIFTVWMGDDITTDIEPDIRIPSADSKDSVEKIEGLLIEKGVIFDYN